MPAPDYSEMFNTNLLPQQERAFQALITSADREKDLQDYDLRGAFAAGLLRSDGRGHLPDTYKKPNHPTFSTESIYHEPSMEGGSWEKTGDNWIFKASPWNVRMHGAPTLQEYFQRIEPGNQLVLPPAQPYSNPPMGVVRG